MKTLDISSKKAACLIEKFLKKNYTYKYYDDFPKNDKEKLRKSALNCWDGRIPHEVLEERKKIIKELKEKRGI